MKLNLLGAWTTRYLLYVDGLGILVFRLWARMGVAGCAWLGSRLVNDGVKEGSRFAQWTWVTVYGMLANKSNTHQVKLGVRLELNTEIRQALSGRCLGKDNPGNLTSPGIYKPDLKRVVCLRRQDQRKSSGTAGLHDISILDAVQINFSQPFMRFNWKPHHRLDQADSIVLSVLGSFLSKNSAILKRCVCCLTQLNSLQPDPQHACPVLCWQSSITSNTDDSKNASTMIPPTFETVGQGFIRILSRSLQIQCWFCRI